MAALRDQVTRIHTQLRACRRDEVNADLPGLIRNLHTILDTGTDHADLLELAVYLHVHVTRQWLVHAAAPTDLVRQTVFLARRLAQERDEVTTLAVAEFAVADVLLAGGALELGRAKLDSLTLPPITAATAGLVYLVTACHAMAAALDRRHGDVAAPMNAAAEVAGRFGAISEVDSRGFAFGPVNAGCFRMWLALEANEPDHVVSIARELDPEQLSLPGEPVHLLGAFRPRAGPAAGRRDDAVRALAHRGGPQPHPGSPASDGPRGHRHAASRHTPGRHRHRTAENGPSGRRADVAPSGGISRLQHPAMVVASRSATVNGHMVRAGR
ncbi:MAG: hypothetical protein ABIZ05_07600 [Pseudonocardiaceae bacterium]